MQTRKTFIILEFIQFINSIDFQLTSECQVTTAADQLKIPPGSFHNLHQTFPIFIYLLSSSHILVLFSASSYSFSSFSICHNSVVRVGRSHSHLCCISCDQEETRGVGQTEVSQHRKDRLIPDHRPFTFPTSTMLFLFLSPLSTHFPPACLCNPLPKSLLIPLSLENAFPASVYTNLYFLSKYSRSSSPFQAFIDQKSRS